MADASGPRLPILDITQLAVCPDYDSDCSGMSVAQVMVCMQHTVPRLTGICAEMQRRQVRSPYNP